MLLNNLGDVLEHPTQVSRLAGDKGPRLQQRISRLVRKDLEDEATGGNNLLISKVWIQAMLT
jgi:hypothetical protein